MLIAEPTPKLLKTSEMEAVLFLEDRVVPSSPTIAGVSLEERALRILLRTGFAEVTVVGEQPPRHWPKLEEKGRIRLTTRWAPRPFPALLFRADSAFERAFPSKIVASSGSPTSAFFCSPGGEPLAILLGQDTSLPEGSGGSFRSLSSRLLKERVETRSLEPGWVCQILESQAEARQFHLRIEKEIIKSTDHMWARWNRRMSVPLSRILAQLPITPNQVTYFTLFVSLLGAFYLSRGGYWEMLLGALLTQISSILDGNDGELARLKIQDSDFGTWLDTLCDYVSYFLTFGAIGWGLSSRYQDNYYLLLVGLFFAGLGITMPLLAYFRKYHTRKGEAGSFKGKAQKTLARLEKNDFWSYLSARIKHVATRATFSYWVVIFGIFDWWLLVLYCAVTGAHAYWIAIMYHARFLKEDG